MIDLSVTTGPLAATNCPVCSSKVNAATGKAPPKEGDLSVCFVCCALLIFNRDMTIRSISDVELKDLCKSEREELFRVRDLVREFLNGITRQ